MTIAMLIITGIVIIFIMGVSMKFSNKDLLRRDSIMKDMVSIIDAGQSVDINFEIAYPFNSPTATLELKRNGLLGLQTSRGEIFEAYSRNMNYNIEENSIPLVNVILKKEDKNIYTKVNILKVKNCPEYSFEYLPIIKIINPYSSDREEIIEKYIRDYFWKNQNYFREKDIDSFERYLSSTPDIVILEERVNKEGVIILPYYREEKTKDLGESAAYISCMIAKSIKENNVILGNVQTFENLDEKYLVKYPMSKIIVMVEKENSINIAYDWIKDIQVKEEKR